MYRVGGDGVEDPRCNVGNVVETQRFQIDAGLLLQAVHYGILQSSFGTEVPEDSALIYASALGDGPDRQPPPVCNRCLMEKIAARVDDPISGLSRSRATQCVVVGTTGSFSLAR
jgi:hypothetical protein